MTEPAPDPRIGVPPAGHDTAHDTDHETGHVDTILFETRGDAPALTMLLAVAALAASGVTVLEATRGQLPHTPGLIAAAATVVLVFLISRARAAGTTISIEQGVVSIDDEEGRRRFDLTTAATSITSVGTPGEPGWSVVFGVGQRRPFGIDDTMVDPVAFTEAVRRWRPDLQHGQR